MGQTCGVQDTKGMKRRGVMQMGDDGQRNVEGDDEEGNNRKWIKEDEKEDRIQWKIEVETLKNADQTRLEMEQGKRQKGG